jgi:hypothetical protein
LLIYILLMATCADGRQPAEKESVLASQALDAIYGYQFDKAQVIISELDKKDYMKSLLELFLIRWREVPVAHSTKNKEYYKLLLSNVESLELDQKKSETKEYLKICTYLFLSEYHSSVDETFSSLKYAQKAYPHVIDAFDKGYSENEFLMIKGLYLYYVELFRQKNFFYAAVALPLRKGSKKDGLELLKVCATKKSMSQIESQIFLAHILLRYEKKPFEALVYSKSLFENYPANLKFTELLIDNLIGCKMYNEALEILGVLENHSLVYYSCPGQFFRGVIEEEHFKNVAKAKIAYTSCANNKYRPVESYVSLANERLKKL